MANPYYNAGGVPALDAPASSADVRAELQQVASAFDKLPILSGNAGKTVQVNAGATGLLAAYPQIPRVDQSGGGFVLDQTKVSKRVFITSTLTIPANVFEPGDWFDVYCDSDVDKTLAAGGGLTLRLHGTLTTGNRLLLKRGVARVYFNSTTDAVVTGSDVS